MAFKIFIDGQEGTTGLQIADRLRDRPELDILPISEEERKDPFVRKKLINESDLTFLCLPDDAAKESVSLLENPRTKIIDASTAHRTDPAWAYGFPELDASFEEKVKTARLIANPGCYPSGFLSVVYPLIKLDILGKDYPFVCHAISGYSGGGKKMIAAYDSPSRSEEYHSVRQYALSQTHKHQPEMKYIAGLTHLPVFNPAVADFYCGMTVSVPLHSRLLNKNLSAKAVWELLSEYYSGKIFVEVLPFMGEGVFADGFLPSNSLRNKNHLQIIVCGNEDRILLAACLDNLGKGAAGAAVQNMNLALGLPEMAGLL